VLKNEEPRGHWGWCQICETCPSTLPRPPLALQIPAYANNASLTRLPRRPPSLPADGIPRAKHRFFLESAASRKPAARYSSPHKAGHLIVSPQPSKTDILVSLPT
jgi:hypothetical protein